MREPLIRSLMRSFSYKFFNAKHSVEHKQIGINQIIWIWHIYIYNSKSAIFDRPTVLAEDPIVYLEYQKYPKDDPKENGNL